MNIRSTVFVLIALCVC